jgi:polar amino acid transport system substrate-binding protein
MKNQFPSLFFALLLTILSIDSGQNSTFAATLKEIQRRGKLIVAVKDNLPPLGFRDSKGNLQGLEIEIARKLAAEIFGDKPHTLELIPVTNQDRLRVVLESKVDLTIAKVTITPTRSRVVVFSRPYYQDGAAIITRQSQIKQTQDLFGQKVAVLNNSSTIATLQYMIPQARLVGVDSYWQAKSLLDAGKVTAFAADRISLTTWLTDNSQYRILPTQLSSEPVGVVIPRGWQYEPLRELVDRSLQRWQTNGWLRGRIEYWGLKNPKIDI